MSILVHPILSFAIGLTIMLPLAGLCIWVSYQLGRKLHITGELTAIMLGIGVFSLPFTVMFGVIFRLLIHSHHLPYDGQYAMSGVAVGGWMGAGAARLQNLKDASAVTSSNSEQ